MRTFLLESPFYHWRSQKPCCNQNTTSGLFPVCSEQLKPQACNTWFIIAGYILQMAWRCCPSVTASCYCRSSFTQLVKKQLHRSGCSTRARPVCVQSSRLVRMGFEYNVHISTGAPCAILPTSSSVCMTFLILPASGLDLTLFRLLLMLLHAATNEIRPAQMAEWL